MTSAAVSGMGGSSPAGLLLTMDAATAKALAGPFFGFSLFPYLAFLFFLSRPAVECPKGVTVGFTVLLLFVFLTIATGITAKKLYGVSLADCDWLHGSAESFLTITNLVIVIAFRQAMKAKPKQQEKGGGDVVKLPDSTPSIHLSAGLIAVATATVVVPALENPTVHTPYLGGFLDLPAGFTEQYFGAHPEPSNALTIATWIIHISSLVEFLTAMDYCWRWGDLVKNPRWKGLTWGLLPLHSSGITACTYHLFYNRIPVLVPLQAFLTCFGNATAAYAAYRIAVSNGWKPYFTPALSSHGESNSIALNGLKATATTTSGKTTKQKESPSRVAGFEDVGNALAGDTDYIFLIKIFVGCAAASYVVKYGETFFDFPYTANVYLGLAIVFIPSALNAFKWYKRSQDPTFDGWF